MDLLAEIGKVTVRWAALDLLLFQILTCVLENAEAAHKIIFNLQGAGLQRLAAFNDTIGASALSLEERSALLDITRRCKDMIGERNDIVHSPMATHFVISADFVRQTTVRMRKDGRTSTVTVADIKKHTTKIGLILHEIEQIAHRLMLEKLSDCEYEADWDDPTGQDRDIAM
ncbi:hypothetical protein SAMN03159406_03870 [Rhizobium sp. NFR03]|nr:hypothetical protein SAMN03159406_03870 [Rhizobium sp. NFR03]